MKIEQYLRAKKSRIERLLDEILSSGEHKSRLDQAMHYAVMNGGKRLRPVLAYASAEALGAEADCADIPACVVELIHAYSLIHDDLPAMDDDALRRGNPTCHIEYDEATAILAGDALQSLAFELLSEHSSLQVADRLRVEMIVTLSRAIGRSGMAGGQTIDFFETGQVMTETDLAIMHGLKTGALIKASVRLGALSTGHAERAQLDALDNYASALGLAFQVQDDILDVEGDTAILGKQQGKDEALGKVTYPSILGLEAARDKARQLCEEAIAALEKFDAAAQPLRDLAAYVVHRSY
ncbi:MAG: (2E,6E)-farnesyl diphosphate synthase [Gammaproteobacteria bacterium]|nr:(2E,6E)-farnesyl diphosphate synthase [Gammaproteobacteria bacterium]MAY03777.1 (2E,6E)-farnesyl diphosphate synthase [Gammaproteobacteria bacterium]|tara:strand:- start:8038 stop:8925 length:888 start_codon:yes stop_codon:yes gene_type:complete